MLEASFRWGLLRWVCLQPRGNPEHPIPPSMSILEMRKDHEEQLQRLKLLKDQEIDAVTSATSHTRCVPRVPEARSLG